MKHTNRIRLCKYCKTEHKQVEMFRICKTSEITGKMVNTNSWCCVQCADKKDMPF